MYVVICIMGVLIELKISIFLYTDKCEMYVCIHLNYEPMKHWKGMKSLKVQHFLKFFIQRYVASWDIWSL